VQIVGRVRRVFLIPDQRTARRAAGALALAAEARLDAVRDSGDGVAVAGAAPPVGAAVAARSARRAGGVGERLAGAPDRGGGVVVAEDLHRLARLRGRALRARGARRRRARPRRADSEELARELV